LLRRQRLLDSENHTGEAVGDVDAIVRADFEDALVEALEDTLRDSRLSAFRSLLEKKWGAEFPRDVRTLAIRDDKYCWYMVYFYTCTLRRMMPRWEHCANKLKDFYLMPVEQIPQGQEWLHL